MSTKNQLTPAEIEPATFRFVAQQYKYMYTHTHTHTHTQTHACTRTHTHTHINFYCYLKILDPMIILIRNIGYCVFVYMHHDII